MSEKLKLLPCPHCGSTNLYLGYRLVFLPFYVRCKACGAEGGKSDDRAEAISAWNQRKEGEG